MSKQESQSEGASPQQKQKTEAKRQKTKLEKILHSYKTEEEDKGVKIIQNDFTPDKKRKDNAQNVTK